MKTGNTNITHEVAFSSWKKGFESLIKKGCYEVKVDTQRLAPETIALIYNYLSNLKQWLVKEETSKVPRQHRRFFQTEFITKHFIVITKI